MSLPSLVKLSLITNAKEDNHDQDVQSPRRKAQRRATDSEEISNVIEWGKTKTTSEILKYVFTTTSSSGVLAYPVHNDESVLAKLSHLPTEIVCKRPQCNTGFNCFTADVPLECIPNINDIVKHANPLQNTMKATVSLRFNNRLRSATSSSAPPDYNDDKETEEALYTLEACRAGFGSPIIALLPVMKGEQTYWVYVFEAGYTDFGRFAKYEAYKTDQATKLGIVENLMKKLELASNARFLLGDMKPANIVFKVEDNSVDVRFIDFDPTYTIVLTPDGASTHCVRLLNTMLLCSSAAMNDWLEVYKFFVQQAAATLNELLAKSYTHSADLCMMVKKVNKERIIEMTKWERIIEMTTYMKLPKDNILERAVFVFWYMLVKYSDLDFFLFDEDYKRKNGIQEETETVSLMETWLNQIVKRLVV